ncbi:chaoptin-like [Paramacrobiotus metropolitanus]|uniref:chaoptin-like n=1 Tax=Paramacrobiotus metropolitanus TaxID=2943436 RepID=UPI0024459BC8|nr:chaoptin-like [Paramacrobiotus metropolitanus]
MARVRPRPHAALCAGVVHLIGLLCLPTALHAAAEAVERFRLDDVIRRSDPLDCKHPAVRFEEPCDCYKLRDVTPLTAVIHCDRVAFRFFPPLPLDVPLHLAVFRHTGYQSLPPELFTAGFRHAHLTALDLAHNALLSLPSHAFSGLEDSLLFLNLSNNNLGSSFQPQLDLPELKTLTNLQFLDLSGNGIKILSDGFFQGLRQLREVYFRDNELMDLSAFAGRDLAGLEVLDVTGNRVFRVESRKLSQLIGLTRLVLRDNFIGQLGGGAFAGTKLRSLDLSGNRLAFLEDDVMAGVESTLEELDVSGNALRTLPNFSQLGKLRMLNLSNNQLEDLETAKVNIPLSLHILDISGNFFTRLSVSDFSALSGLTEFYLSRNFLGVLQIQSGNTFPNLKILDLTATNISTLSSNFWTAFPNITDLELSYNNFPSGFAGQSSSLQRLSLRKCKIQKLDKKFFENFRLSSLDLSGNFLDNLPNLPTNISDLNLSWNKFIVIPSLAQTPLINLDVSGNFINNVSLDNLPMASLVTFNISRNKLDTLPLLTSEEQHRDFLGDTRSMPAQNSAVTFPLQILDASFNQIQSLDRVLTGWSQLRKLYLAGNRIQMITSFFLSDLSNLEEVDLAGNGLSMLENRTFLRLASLQRINLRNNQIKVFNGFAFDMLTKLQHLDLSSNQLQSVHPKNPFEKFPSLKTVILSDNNLKEFALRDFVANSSIVRLIMEHCHLLRLSIGTFDNMEHLRELRLNDNNIAEMQEGLFSSTPQLQIIDLQRNDISSLSENVFRQIRRLELLDLGYNKLESLKRNTFAKEKIDRLENLNLEGNRLTEIPINALSDQEFNLISLNLKSNNIAIIPSGSLISTKHLNIAFNPLKADSIRLLLSEPKLTFALDLSGTGLSDLPPLQLQFLSALNLSHNRLTSCGDPVSWDRAALLTVLDLSFNWISSMQESQLTVVLPKLAFLKVLNLSNNLLRNIRENDFAGLINLDTLDVSNQPRLETFDISNFMQLPRLQSLFIYNYPRLINFPLEDISYQPLFLRTLHVEIKKPLLKDDLDGFLTPGLRSLTITGKSLREVSPRAFRSLNPSTISMSFENTSLETLPAAAVFGRFPRNSMVDFRLSGSQLAGMELAGLLQNAEVERGAWLVEGNQLDCTCNVSLLQPVWRSVREAGPGVPNVVCDAPAGFRGKNVLFVETTEETCAQMTEPTERSPVIKNAANGNRASKSGGNRDDRRHFQPSVTEPEIIFEVTSPASTTPAPPTYRMEGMIAGIILATLLLTGAIILAIVCWNRREKQRRRALLLQSSRHGLACESQYAVFSNPDIVAHPTWYPPPKPVFVVPLSPSFDPHGVAGGALYLAPDSVSSAPSVDYTVELGEPTSESEFGVIDAGEVEMDSRITYSYMEAGDTTDEGPYSEDYFPDDDSVEASYRQEQAYTRRYQMP